MNIPKPSKKHQNRKIKTKSYQSLFTKKLKLSRQIAGRAAKEQTCVPYNRDRNIYRSKQKKSTPLVQI